MATRAGFLHSPRRCDRASIPRARDTAPVRAVRTDPHELIHTNSCGRQASPRTLRHESRWGPERRSGGWHTGPVGKLKGRIQEQSSAAPQVLCVFENHRSKIEPSHLWDTTLETLHLPEFLPKPSQLVFSLISSLPLLLRLLVLLLRAFQVRGGGPRPEPRSAAAAGAAPLVASAPDLRGGGGAPRAADCRCSRRGPPCRLRPKTSGVGGAAPSPVIRGSIAPAG